MCTALHLSKKTNILPDKWILHHDDVSSHAAHGKVIFFVKNKY
jgi:hypothetical protein